MWNIRIGNHCFVHDQFRQTTETRTTDDGDFRFNRDFTLNKCDDFLDTFISVKPRRNGVVSLRVQITPYRLVIALGCSPTDATSMVANSDVETVEFDMINDLKAKKDCGWNSII